ncbi:unknown [Bacteroides sp. CAG:598]|nr:unknown [Bacteroides sp. CAG:598]
MGFQIDSGLRFGYLVVRHEQTTSGYLVLIIGIRDEHIIMSHQPAIPVYTSEIGKIEHALLLTDRIGRVVTVVGFHGYHILFTKLQQRAYIHDNWQIATIVFLYQTAVHIHFAFAHNAFKVHKQLLAFQAVGRSEMFPIPGHSLIIGTTAGLHRQIFQTVRHRNNLPICIVIVHSVWRSIRFTFPEPPGLIQGIGLTPGIRQFIKTGCRETGHVSISVDSHQHTYNKKNQFSHNKTHNLLFNVQPPGKPSVPLSYLDSVRLC